MVLCADAGTYILYKKEVPFSQTVPFEIGNELVSDLEKYNIEWLLEGEKTHLLQK